MKRLLILGILITSIASMSLISCGKKENKGTGTNVTIGNTDNEKSDNASEDTDEDYTDMTFDDFIYSDYTGLTEKTRPEGNYLNYSFNTKYNGTYNEKERLELKKISENISQALFYGDTYKDHDKTLKYVLSFIKDDQVKETTEAIFKSNFCNMLGETYPDDKIVYNKDKIWSGENYMGSIPYICTEWTIKYKHYDKYDVEQEEYSNSMFLTFIRKNNKWLLTDITTK